MAAKPSEKIILQTYTLNELLDLIKEKARMDAETQLNNAREHLSALALAIGGETERSSRGIPKVRGRRRGRPRKSDAAPQPADRDRKRGRKKIPLGQLLQEILGASPMGIEDIMLALKGRGYTSKSKDPRRVLYLELKKQVENKNIKKTGRGMYAMK